MQSANVLTSQAKLQNPASELGSLPTFAQLSRFQEFSALPNQTRQALLESFVLTTYAPGSVIVKKGKCDQGQCFFLVEGEMELRHSFEERDSVIATDEHNNRAFNALIRKTTTIRALTSCVVASVKELTLNEEPSLEGQLGVMDVEDTEFESISEHALIDDSFERDWQTNFIQSPLAMNLPYEAILQLLSVMEDVEVQEGEEIVKVNTQGDYFYLIKSGEAQVRTEASGPYRGEAFVLEAGQYFGDEALVAKTARNASVTMKTKGLVGRFSADMFDELIGRYLVLTEPATFEVPVSPKIVDVRFPAEIARGLEGNTQNIPISQLRKRLDGFDKDSTYLVTPANDCRSNLATYLMRQAGISAFVAAEEAG
jgi:CRP-like cAMP-binding protein